jgi:hypothetical protein
MASYNSGGKQCTYVPHFSMKFLNRRDFLTPTSDDIHTYVLACEPVMHTNVLLGHTSGDLFAQAAEGWTISSTCQAGNTVGRADHRYSPSSFKSHVAGYQYSWMAQERRMQRLNSISYVPKHCFQTKLQVPKDMELGLNFCSMGSSQ